MFDDEEKIDPPATEGDADGEEKTEEGEAASESEEGGMDGEDKEEADA